MENNQGIEPGVPENETVLFQWNHQIKMLFNPVLWKSFVACLGIPTVLLGIGFSFTGDLRAASLLTVGLLAFFAVIWAATGIVIDLGGGFFASYVITTKGIYFSSGPNAKKAASVATAVGVLAGSASAAGAGFLAKSEQDNAIEWTKVKKVKVSKGLRYILIRERFGSKPIGLYCNQENFEQILALVQSKFQG